MTRPGRWQRVSKQMGRESEAGSRCSEGQSMARQGLRIHSLHGSGSDVSSLLLFTSSWSLLFALCQAVRRLERREMSETFELWQIKLVLEFFSSRSHQERMSRNPTRGLFMNSEFLPVMKCTIDNTLDQWLQGTEERTQTLQP